MKEFLEIVIDSNNPIITVCSLEYSDIEIVREYLNSILNGFNLKEFYKNWSEKDIIKQNHVYSMNDLDGNLYGCGIKFSSERVLKEFNSSTNSIKWSLFRLLSEKKWELVSTTSHSPGGYMQFGNLSYIFSRS